MPLFTHFLIRAAARARNLYRAPFARGGNPAGDSGIDVRFPEDVVFAPRATTTVPLGIRVRFIHGPHRSRGAWVHFATVCVAACAFAVGGSRLALAALVLALPALLATRRAPAPYNIYPRSSIGVTPLMLANSVAVIDRGYQGELKVQVRNAGDAPYRAKRGSSLFQLTAPNLEPTTYYRVDPGSPDDRLYFAKPTLRAAGGLGSTGPGGRE